MTDSMDVSPGLASDGLPAPDSPVLASALQGAIDLHRHGYPETSFGVHSRHDDIVDLRMCASAGFTAVVLKSHMWPTVGRAYHLNQVLGGEGIPLDVIPSITLNASAGGFLPQAVESAALQGAKVVFMPTWSAAHDIERGGMSTRMSQVLKRSASYGLSPLTVVDGNGRIKPEVRETLNVANEYAMSVCTGHISPLESLALAESGLIPAQRLVFSHPDSGSVGATSEETRLMAEYGAFIELTALGTLPPFHRALPAAMYALAVDIGIDRCVITSDYYFSWAPPSSEIIRMFVGLFLEAGASPRDINRMLSINPAVVLGLRS